MCIRDRLSLSLSADRSLTVPRRHSCRSGAPAGWRLRTSLLWEVGRPSREVSAITRLSAVQQCPIDCYRRAREVLRQT
eukprot:3225514-Alexandrium_andersonii.AAC.1